MDPFQTNGSYLSVYLLKENPITRTRVGFVYPLESTAVRLWDVRFSRVFWYVRQDHVDWKPVASGVQVDAMRPLKIWMHPLEIRKVPNINMPINPMKPCDTLPHPHVASAEPPWLDKAQNKKYVYASCLVIEHIM